MKIIIRIINEIMGLFIQCVRLLGILLFSCLGQNAFANIKYLKKLHLKHFSC